MRMNRDRVRTVLVAVALAVVTLAVYAPVRDHAFVTIDDEHYLYGNRVVRAGLTPEGAAWAFRSTEVSNWHPLTWLSHMADVSIFGMDPGSHHLVSVAFHAANAILVFLLLFGTTGAFWPAAFAAALFAVHPLHVESVAWASERKDVLSVFLGLLALLAYARYARRPSPGAYAAVLLLFAAGLLAKPMLVTLPFAMLLMDWWPLARIAGADGPGAAPPPVRVPASRLVLEKVPLFALSAASCVVTYLVQQRGGAMTALPLPDRAANAVVAFAAYLGKTVWPGGLAAIYPYPAGGHPAWQVAGAAALLALATVAALLQWKRRPWLTVGFLWFAGTLVPVSGIVRIGAQAMADRYTYLPHIGLFVAAVWAGVELGTRFRVSRPVAAAGLAVVAAFAIGARVQAGYWKDSVTLFSRTLELTSGNYLAAHNLGIALEDEGKLPEAALRYQEALRIQPFHAESHNNLGIVLARLGRSDEAIRHLREALRLSPGRPEPHNNLGLALARAGRLEEAVGHFREALRLDPGHEAARANLRFALESLGAGGRR